MPWRFRIYLTRGLILGLSAWVSADEADSIITLTHAQSKAASKAKRGIRLAQEFIAQLGGANIDDWHGIDLSVPPDPQAPSSEKAAYKLKLLDLDAYCREERFQDPAQVQAAEFLNEGEKRYCEERIRVLQANRNGGDK